MIVVWYTLPFRWPLKAIHDPFGKIQHILYKFWNINLTVNAHCILFTISAQYLRWFVDVASAHLRPKYPAAQSFPKPSLPHKSEEMKAMKKSGGISMTLFGQPATIFPRECQSTFISCLQTWRSHALLFLPQLNCYEREWVREMLFHDCWWF